MLVYISIHHMRTEEEYAFSCTFSAGRFRRSEIYERVKTREHHRAKARVLEMIFPQGNTIETVKTAKHLRKYETRRILQEKASMKYTYTDLIGETP